MAGANTLQFTDANFEQEVLKSSTPVLVDFWAEWCQPCKALTPIIDQLAAEYQGKVKVGKLDIDANQQQTAKYRVGSIPTVIVFKNGQVFGSPLTGLRSKKDFITLLDSALGQQA